jgi:hypothetical protein
MDIPIGDLRESFPSSGSFASLGSISNEISNLERKGWIDLQTN